MPYVLDFHFLPHQSCLETKNMELAMKGDFPLSVEISSSNSGWSVVMLHPIAEIQTQQPVFLTEYILGGTSEERTSVVIFLLIF